MPRLIGLLQSPYVRRVEISMRLLGIPFEPVRLSVFADKDALSAINPAIKVPALVLDDGTRLLDSNLILDWLDRQVEPAERLLPEGPQRWPLVEVIGHAMVLCEKAVQVMLEYRVREAAIRSPAWLERCRGQIHAVLDVLENSPLLTPSERPDQAVISTAVALHFVQFVAGRTSEPLFDEQRWPRLAALADWAAQQPVFRNSPLN